MGRKEVYDATGNTYEFDRYGSPHMQLYLSTRSDALQRVVAREARPLRILEVGCGPGLSLSAVARTSTEHFVVGLDFSQTMLKEAQQRGRGLGNRPRLVKADALRLPLEDGAFDVVYSTRFIHQFPQHLKQQVFSELMRVTKKGGLVVVEFYARPYHLLRYYLQRIKEAKSNFLSHFPTKRDVDAIVARPYSTVPLRLAGAKVLYGLMGERGLAGLTRLGARWPFRILLDEYFVALRK